MEKKLSEKDLSKLVGRWCRVEVLGEKNFKHTFPTDVNDVTLRILEGEYHIGLFTCWMYHTYPNRIKITPIDS